MPGPLTALHREARVGSGMVAMSSCQVAARLIAPARMGKRVVRCAVPRLGCDACHQATETRMTPSNVPPLDATEILGGIRAWVEIESPTTDAAAVNRIADRVQQDYASIGARIERIVGRDGFGDHLLVTSPWGDNGPGILVLS